MELQEKYTFAQEKLIYDTIPLIIFDKVERKNSKGLYKSHIIRQNLSCYFVKIMVGCVILVL